MKILITNGKAFINDELVQKDILIEDNRIIKISDVIEEASDRVIDAENKVVLPGFIDLHTHLRDPGQTHKEDIVTGTAAAAKGGFTTICVMPNTYPVVDNIATVEYIQRKAADLGKCKVKVIGAMTKGSEGKEISEYAIMKEGGIVAVSDDGGCVQNAKLSQNCMKYAYNFDLPVIVHAEDYNLAGSGLVNAGKISSQLGLGGIPGLAEEIIIARDIMLAESIGVRLHIAHISTAKGIELVRKAKADGISITAEVTPHHLTMNEDAVYDFDTNTKVKPPLRREKDRLACITALKDGTIDYIATDHAPHSDYEKEKEYNIAPFGINGFETAFASLNTFLVKKDALDLATIVKAMSEKPAQFLGIKTGKLAEGYLADLNIIDLDAEIEFNRETMLSKSINTPYINQTLLGKVNYTICEGRVTWEAGEIER
ncbi:dihydroorotase [bacterium]|nr:dihydroorotase [bacterium]